MSTKTETLTAIIEPVVESFDLQLWGLQYAGQGHHALLRIFIDGENGVGVDDCAKVSRQLGAVLDVEDPISGKYTLEVSSPGLDRSLFALKQYAAYVGSTIKLKLNAASAAKDKRKKMKATLLSVDEDAQTLQVNMQGDGEDEIITIDFINIDKANIVGDYSTK
jgi:ribosome maturation factor RimP